MKCYLCTEKQDQKFEDKEFGTFSALSKHLRCSHKFEQKDKLEFYKKYYSEFYEKILMSQNEKSLDPYKFIQCQICFKYFAQITEDHMKKKHNIALKEYKEKFPNAKILSDNVFDKISKKSTGRKFPDSAKRKMSDAKKKRVKEGTYISPVFLMTEDKKKEWKKNISIAVKKEFSNLSDEQVKQRLKHKYISNIETNFLDFLEKQLQNIGYLINIKRQLRIVLDTKQTKFIDGAIRCSSFDIFIEVDGKYWHNFPYGTIKDVELDNYCFSRRIKLFRFWDEDIIKNREKCANEVLSYLCDLFDFYEALALKELGGQSAFDDYLYECEES
jgi:very-short-patch-repair endonuclease